MLFEHLSLPLPLTDFRIPEAYAAIAEEPGDFAVRGGIVDLYPPSLSAPVRLDFFGDILESIRTFDPDVRKVVLERFEQIVRGIAETMGCQVEIELVRVTPALTNNDAIAQTVQGTGRTRPRRSRGTPVSGVQRLGGQGRLRGRDESGHYLLHCSCLPGPGSLAPRLFIVAVEIETPTAVN